MSFGDFIEKNLLDAGRISRESFGGVGSTVKKEDPNQVLTETDLKIGAALIAAITSTYPGHNIIDEEAGSIDRGSDYTWVIDPIDGTSNFANAVPTYGTLLGLLYEGVPVAGGMILPFFHDLYLAERGHGTRRNGQPVHVTRETALMNVLVGYGIDSRSKQPGQTRDELQTLGRIVNAIRNLRTSNSAFDAAMVIDGRYGACLNQQSKIWDNVAQHVLIEEAGGLYTDFFGQPIDYRHALQRAGDTFTWCAGAPTIHQQLQQLIHSR